jgi:preprotein translocase subunit SecF
MILAGVCIVAAAFFLLRRDFDSAFVIAALGMVAWFLNYRVQMKEIVTAANLQEGSRRDEKESWEASDNDPDDE